MIYRGGKAAPGDPRRRCRSAPVTETGPTGPESQTRNTPPLTAEGHAAETGVGASCGVLLMIFDLFTFFYLFIQFFFFRTQKIASDRSVARAIFGKGAYRALKSRYRRPRALLAGVLSFCYSFYFF